MYTRNVVLCIIYASFLRTKAMAPKNNAVNKSRHEHCSRQCDSAAKWHNCQKYNKAERKAGRAKTRAETLMPSLHSSGCSPLFKLTTGGICVGPCYETNRLSVKEAAFTLVPRQIATASRKCPELCPKGHGAREPRALPRATPLG